MPDWTIVSTDNGNPRWKVELADCSLEHAESVLVQLEADGTVPSNLVLHEVVPEPESVSWWKRLARWR